MNTAPIMAMLCVFLVVSLATVLIGKVLSSKSTRLETRLSKFLSRSAVEDTAALTVDHKPASSILQRLISVVGKSFTGKSFVRRWEVRIEQAALPIKPEEFFALRLLCAAALAFGLFILEYRGVVLLPGILLGYWAPRFYLQRRKVKRLGRCSNQLVTALGTMSTAMKAGFSFMQAMQLIGREVPDPLGPEFDRTIREINFGVSLEESFRRLMERLPDADLELMVTAVMIQRTTGGNLAEILESIQETIQERVRIKEELHALTAQGRMSAWVISLLPVFLGFVLNFISPEYFSPMVKEPLGWALLTVGAVSGFIGWMAIRKIVQIEV